MPDPTTTAPKGPHAPAPPTDGGAAVRLQGVTKRFGDLTAVDDVSFEVRSGELFAFLGPNGAGKSTTIRILCTLSTPTAGRAEVAGHDVSTAPREVRSSIGLVFQEQTLDEQLTADENLRLHAALYGVPTDAVEGRLQRVLEMVALEDRRSDLVDTFSGGMARRLEIARGLIHTPEVLFLDEPTVGLDPQTRARIWQDVQRLRDEEGVTVFFSTHYMDEAEYADRIAIIDHGQIVAIDTPAALKAAVGRDIVQLATDDDEAAARRLAAAGIDVERGDGVVVARVDDGEGEVARLIGLTEQGVRNAHVRRPTLDDVFLHFTGHELRDRSSEGDNSAMRRFARARRR